MNIKNTSWNSYLDTLRVEIDQAISGCFALSTHHNKFHRLTTGLSHFSKKLIDFVDEKRTTTKEELVNFQGLIKILLNLNHFIDDFSDFSIDKTIEVIGIDFFNSPLNEIMNFITNFNHYTQQLELPQISIDESLLKGEDNVIDIAQLLNFIQSRAFFFRAENKEIASLYENLTNKVFDSIESDNQIIKDIFIRRKEFLSRKGKSNSKTSSSGFYGSYELYKALKSSPNVRIIKHSDIDIDRSHCVHHGKYSSFFSGVLKSSKRIASFEIYQSVIFSQNEYNAFIQKVKIMSESNYFTTIPLIGVVLDEPFIIVSEFMPQRSLYDWFHGQSSKEFSNENDSHIEGLAPGQQRKFKMQFDQSENMSNDLKSRPSVLTLNSSSSFGSYQQIRKEASSNGLRQTIIALGVAYALRYLHSKGIVHMSLKTSEIFIDANGRPKIKCSKKARKVKTKIEKISCKNVKAWTAPELIDTGRLLNESTDGESEIIDDEGFDEDSVGNSGKDRSQIHHCLSAVSFDLNQYPHNHQHLHGAKKDSRKYVPVKKIQSAGINYETPNSPAPLPLMPNSNDPNDTNSDFLNKTVVLSNKVDVYAYGIMLWELLTKEIAFAGLSSSLIAQEVLLNDQRPLIPQNCPAKLVKLIQDCWSKDPKMRPDFDEICLMLESGNYNFPGTDTEELNSYKSYCAKIIEKLKKKDDDEINSSEFAEFDKFQLNIPDSFYNDPNLNIEMMINKFIKEGSCEDYNFIKKLSELVKSSAVPQINLKASFQLKSLTKSSSSNSDKEKDDENKDSIYIFNESSLSLLSSFFLSSNLNIRLVAVDLVTYIYNNHLFNDERSIAEILPKIVRSISQISSLSTHFVNFKVTEAQEIVITSMKLLILLSSKYVTSGFINNKISNASINSIINMAFSECSSLREVSFDFYISFLSKFQASNKLLIRFITKMARFNVAKAMCIECIKIIKVLQLISRNDRLFTLISLDEKTLETVSNFLIYDELEIKQEKSDEEDQIIHDNSKAKEDENESDSNEDASNFKLVLNMMKSKENKSDGNLLKKLTHKENADDVVISALRLLFTLVSGSQYLYYYTKMVDKLSTKLFSNNKIISSLSCSVITRLIPTISENIEPFTFSNEVSEAENFPEFNCDKFSFLKDEILLKLSENLDEYSIRLFGAISSTYVSASINTRNDEIILQRILKKMKESLKPIKKEAEEESKENNDNDNNKEEENETTTSNEQDPDKNNSNISFLFNKISNSMQKSNLRSNNLIPTMKPNLKINSNVDAFPLLFQKDNNHFAEEEKKREEEGRLAALVLESQSSQTPSSKVLIEAIDIFFEYYFFFNEENVQLTFDEEDKFRECLIFLSNMSLDPKAALCIFKRIDKILHIISLKNSPAASTFFHVLLTYEVQERIRRICKKHLQNEFSDDNESDNDDDDDDESEYENDDEIELLHERELKDLIQDIIKKCVCFWNTIYFEDALRLLEFFSTIPVARKLFIKFGIDTKIRDFIKNFSIEKQQSFALEIQQEKKILEQLKQQQINQQNLTESLLIHQENDQNSDDNDENSKAQKQLIENHQKNQHFLRQIKQQEEKVENLKMKEMKFKNRDAYLRGLCNRILSRFV